MAASSWDRNQPRIRATAAGGIPPIRKFPEAAGQTYKAGALVYLDATNGRITALADSGTKILGIAQEDASTTTSTRQAVQIINPGDEVLFQCWDASDGATVLADTLKAGFTYDVELDANLVSWAEYDSEHATTEELIFLEAVYDVNGTATTWGVFTLEGVAMNTHQG